MAQRHFFKNQVQSFRILIVLYHIPRYFSISPDHQQQYRVTLIETLVFNPFTGAIPFRCTRCFSFPHLFFSPYLVSTITSTIPIVVNLSETFGKLAVIAGRWAGPRTNWMREEERVGDERKVEERKRRSGELESDCVRKRMVQKGGSGCHPPPLRWVLQGCRMVS